MSPRDPDCELDPDDGWIYDPQTNAWAPDHDCPAEDGDPCWCSEGRNIARKETA